MIYKCHRKQRELKLCINQRLYSSVINSHLFTVPFFVRMSVLFLLDRCIVKDTRSLLLWFFFLGGGVIHNVWYLCNGLTPPQGSCVVAVVFHLPLWLRALINIHSWLKSAVVAFLKCGIYFWVNVLNFGILQRIKKNKLFSFIWTLFLLYFVWFRT